MAAAPIHDAASEGALALIVGGSRGIGRACAMRLAGRFRDVRIASRVQPASEGWPSNVGWIQADLARVDSLGSAQDAAARCAVLVIVPPRVDLGSALSTPASSFREAYESNFIAPLLLLQAAVGRMAERGYGRVVVISGASTRSPLPNHAAVNAARTALLAVVAGLAKEVAARNVTLNSILPSAVATEGLRMRWEGYARERGVTYQEVHEENVSRNPSRRIGSPDEIAALCDALTNFELGFVTGQAMLFDGGAFPGLF